MSSEVVKINLAIYLQEENIISLSDSELQRCFLGNPKLLAIAKQWRSENYQEMMRLVFKNQMQ